MDLDSVECMSRWLFVFLVWLPFSDMKMMNGEKGAFVFGGLCGILHICCGTLSADPEGVTRDSVTRCHDSVQDTRSRSACHFEYTMSCYS
jgi:hypothetical protein